MILSILIALALLLAVAWLMGSVSEDYDECCVCCIGVKKNSLVFVNLKGVGWTIVCPHCVNIYGIDETPEGRKIAITIPYWISQPAAA